MSILGILNGDNCIMAVFVWIVALPLKDLSSSFLSVSKAYKMNYDTDKTCKILTRILI